MRIAVLVYGRLRKCGDHYKNIMEHLGDHTFDFFGSSDNSSESSLDDFVKLYAPKQYTNKAIEYTYDLTKYPNKPGETILDHMARHFINKNRVFALLEDYMAHHSVQYDCVVSLRVDCVFQTKFHFDQLEENTIYIPSGNDHYHGINDQLAYGTFDVMKKYNSIDIVDLLEKGLSIPHPESLNHANLNYKNVIIKRIQIDYFLSR